MQLEYNAGYAYGCDEERDCVIRAEHIVHGLFHFYEITNLLRKTSPTLVPLLAGFDANFKSWKRMRGDVGHRVDRVSSGFIPDLGNDAYVGGCGGWLVAHYNLWTDTMITGKSQDGRLNLDSAIALTKTCADAVCQAIGFNYEAWLNSFKTR